MKMVVQIIYKAYPIIAIDRINKSDEYKDGD